ncbi:MAG: Opr family porin [Desulfobacterales bacterium]|nr:Opr family porin [Desulfobacterales bacterium]
MITNQKSKIENLKINRCLMLFYTMIMSVSICFADTIKEETPLKEKSYQDYFSLQRFTGSLGGYFERKNIHNKPDNGFTALYGEINYTSPVRNDFGFSLGTMGHICLDETTDGDYDAAIQTDLLLRELYLTYQISKTLLRLGRHEIKPMFILDDYYEGLSLTSKSFQNIALHMALVYKFGKSDVDLTQNFKKLNHIYDGVDNYFLAMQMDWNLISKQLNIKPFACILPDGFILYGLHGDYKEKLTHSELWGMVMDYYATDEDKTHGLANNTSVYHINAYVQAPLSILSGGVIQSDKSGGTRVGGIIDDYFNPFNEGYPFIYQKDAFTWYGKLMYMKDMYKFTLTYGQGKHDADQLSPKHTEMDIDLTVIFMKKWQLLSNFSRVTVDALIDDYSKLELKLSHSF